MQTLTEIKAILASRGLRPKHRFGQNFLHDHNVLRLLMKAANISAGEVILEVGPGTGVLTDLLVAANAHVIACEMDRDLAAFNRERFQERITLIEGDCLASKHSLNPDIIAAINGPAIGAGNDLACMCDIRIASRTARFAESFVKVGIVPGDGGCWFLPRLVGFSRAAEMALTGETIDADEALRTGLVSKLVEPEQLLAEAMALALRIAANPPQVLRWTKQLLLQARTATLDEALDSAGLWQGQAHHTADHAEAVAAFFDKRPPVFKGS